jgi:phytanoyl-CoA hydroxylase
MPFLSREQLAHFKEEGYLLVRGMLDVEEVIQPIIDEYHGVLDKLAHELYAAGHIESTYNDLPFGKRLTQIVVDSGEVHAQYFDFSLPQNGIEADTPFWAGPAVFRCLSNPALLDVAESIVGPEIWSNPVQHVRIKPPERLVPKDHNGQALVTATSWHQDSGVVLPEADTSNVLTVWFPLNEATLENGCLQIMPNSHRQGTHTHCPGHPGGLRVPEQVMDMDSAMPVPMQPGDVLFLTRHTIHGSLSNHSDDVRWSFDLRYNPIGQTTGRDIFPGFIARSKAQPENVLSDPVVWEKIWRDTRNRLALEEQVVFNRWSADAAVCA